MASVKSVSLALIAILLGLGIVLIIISSRSKLVRRERLFREIDFNNKLTDWSIYTWIMDVVIPFYTHQLYLGSYCLLG